MRALAQQMRVHGDEQLVAVLPKGRSGRSLIPYWQVASAGWFLIGAGFVRSIWQKVAAHG
jgi:hypothetical protein